MTLKWRSNGGQMAVKWRSGADLTHYKHNQSIRSQPIFPCYIFPSINKLLKYMMLAKIPQSIKIKVLYEWL